MLKLEFRIVIDAAAQDRFAAFEAALGELVAEVEAAGGIAGEGAKLQLVVAVGQDNGAALGVEHGDGVVEDRVQQFGFALEMHQVVSGAKQSEELFVQASPLGRAALDNVRVRKSDVTRLLELCAGRNDELGRCAARLAARPFGECVSGVLEQAAAWAAREDKQVNLDVNGREELVPRALAEVT